MAGPIICSSRSSICSSELDGVLIGGIGKKESSSGDCGLDTGVSPSARGETTAAGGIGTGEVLGSVAGSGVGDDALGNRGDDAAGFGTVLGVVTPTSAGLAAARRGGRGGGLFPWEDCGLLGDGGGGGKLISVVGRPVLLFQGGARLDQDADRPGPSLCVETFRKPVGRGGSAGGRPSEGIGLEPGLPGGGPGGGGKLVSLWSPEE
ncbi:hypothetical protein PG988_000241 [Apiospora saccharicola]